MSANFKFIAYEGQEGDEQIGMSYVPAGAVDDEIGAAPPRYGHDPV